MATYVVLLALVAAATAVPARYNYDQQFSCATTCSANQNKFNYEVGETYIYDYEVDTKTSMAGASEDTAELNIKAKADIHVVSKCNFVLRLRDVTVSHSEAYSRDQVRAARSAEFRDTLQKYTARFSFDNGVISNICPAEGEELFALNFKRGLLSAFQNSIQVKDGFKAGTFSVPETDVTGNCEATYDVKGTTFYSSARGITKTKDLLACSERNSYKTILQMVPYVVPSEIQNVPILKMSHKCNYVVNSNTILESVQCDESHVFIPFSNQQSGGRTTVQQSLKLHGTSKDRFTEVTDNSERRLSLLFQHDESASVPSQGHRSASEKLKAICDHTTYDIRPETPREFSELVEIIKGLNYADLNRVYRKLKSNNLCAGNERGRKFFMDALPMAGTEGPVRLMVDILTKKEVEGFLAKGWISSLAFIQRPSEGMIKALVPLFDEEAIAGEAKLPVSALVYAFCQYQDCETNYHVNTIVTKIAAPIGYYCSVDDESLGKILLSLRALGNLGVSHDVTSALNKCLTAAKSPLEVKIAAADAYRRVPCGVSQNDELWTSLRDSSEDSEQRIAAYVALMRCPDQKTLNKIQAFLENVEDEQVASYIYTHLKNLGETSDPHKQELAAAVNKLTLRKVEVSPFKSSRNFEASVLINKLNMGAVVDSDLIMASAAPVPRAARLNLTMELFGNSINALEVGGRIVGLEYLIEKLLGSYGYSSKSSRKQINNLLDEVRASSYARVFGNELSFHHMKGISPLLKSLKNTPNILEHLISFFEKKAVSYSHSQKIIDVSIIVPTAAGIPMNVVVNGSASLDLSAEGKVDLRQTSSLPRSLEITGDIRPSAALEVSGEMIVDAHFTKLGLRMRNTMQSSTGVKALVEINRDSEFKVEIEQPRDKMEVFQARSQFYIKVDEVEKEQEMIKDNYKTFKACTGAIVAKVLGTEVCGELKYANASQHDDAPYFPLAGPGSFSVVMNRKDSHKTYKLYAKKAENKKGLVMQFQLNTPGSRVNRLISTDLTVSYDPNRSVDIVVISPWKKVDFNTAVVSNRGLLSVVGSALLDDKDKYGITSEMKISRSRNQVVYTPFVEITKRDVTHTLLSGQVDMTLWKTAEANLEIKLADKPIEVKGRLVNLEKEKRARLSVATDKRGEYLINVGSIVNWSGKGKSLDVTPEFEVKTPTKTLISVTGSGNYRAEKFCKADLTINLHRMKPASFSIKRRQYMKNKQPKYDIDMTLKSALISASVDSTTTKKNNVMATNVKVNYNVPSVSKNSLTWSAKLTDRSKNMYKKFTLKSDFSNREYPDYNLGLTFDIDHKNKHSEGDLKLTYGPDPRSKTKVVTLFGFFDSKVKDLSKADVTVRLGAKAPEKDINMALKATHSHSSRSLDTDLTLKMEPLMKKDVDVHVSVKDRSRKLLNYVGSGRVDIFGKKYNVDSTLTQKSSKQFIHSLNLKTADDKKHSIVTVYRTPKDQRHEVTSNIDLADAKPIQLDGKVSLDSKNMQASGTLIHDKDVYSITSRFKLAKKAGRWNIDVQTPERNIEMSADGMKAKDKYSGKVSVNWDATKKASKQSTVVLDGSFRHSEDYEMTLINGDVNLQTPFQNFENLGSNMKVTIDPERYNVNGKMSWGRKKISSDLLVKKPLTLANVQVTFDTQTPFRSYREIGLEIDHTINSGLMTLVKGKMENEDAELMLQGQNSGKWGNVELAGSLGLKTSFKSVRNLNVTLNHKADSSRTASSGLLVHNGMQYDALLWVDQNSYGSKLDHNTKMVVNWPQNSLEANWNHKSTGLNSVKSTLDAKWDGNKHLAVDLTGSNKVSWYGRTANGKLTVRSPWRNYRDLVITMNHEHTRSKLHSSSSTFINKQRESHYDVLVEEVTGGHKASIKILSPSYKEEINGHGTIIYERYPATASAWLVWSPYQRIDFDGSVNAPSVDDMQVDAKLTTPFTHFENIDVKGSHQLKNGEYVSRGNVAYGVRKMIDFETRLRNDQSVKMVSTKLVTPFAQMRKLDTGFQVDLKPTGISGKADFEMRPLVKKYDTIVKYNFNQGDLNGKIRVNTPHRSMRYLELSGRSERNNDGSRSSHIELEQASVGVYSIDTSYRTQAPYQFDVTVKTPNPEYTDVGAMVFYNPGYRSCQSKVRVTYLPRKEIASEMKLNLNRDIDVSWTLNTPFEDFESNAFVFRTNFDLSDLTSHAEARIGQDNTVGDLTFANTGYVTTGTFKLNTPLRGLEKIESSLKLRGKLNDLKGDASLNLGSDVFRTAFTNKVNPTLLKQTIIVFTPYTKDLKLDFNIQDKSNYRTNSFEGRFKGVYGNKEAETSASATFTDLNNVDFEFSLNSPSDLLKSIKITAKQHTTGDEISGKATLESNFENLRNVEIIYSEKGSINNMKGKFVVKKDSDELISALAQTSRSEGEVHGNLEFKGLWMPTLGAKMDHTGDLQDFKTNLRLESGNGNVLDHEVVFKMDDLILDLTSSTDFKTNNGDFFRKVTIHKEGTLDDFKIDITENADSKTYGAVIQLATTGKFAALAKMTGLRYPGDVIGFEFDHSGDLEKFLTTVKATLNKHEEISGKVDFYRYQMQRVQAEFELYTPFKGYEFTKYEYRHEGTPNERLSCSTNLQYSDKKMSLNLVTVSHPSPKMLLTLKTPVQDVSISVDAGKRNYDVHLIINKEEFSLTSVLDSSKYPYHPMCKITTTFPFLKEAVINVKGDILDGSADLTVHSNDRKIEASAALKYDNPLSMSASAELSAGRDLFEPLSFSLNNVNDAVNGKMTTLELGYGGEKVHGEGRFLLTTDPWSSKETREFSMDFKLPLPELKTLVYNLKHTLGEGTEDGKLYVQANGHELLDMDFDMTTVSKKAASVTLRKPWPMDYSASAFHDSYKSEYEVSANWNRNDPESNLVLKSSATDNSNRYTTDKKMVVSLVLPTRTMGFDFDTQGTSAKVSSQGKLYWDDKDTSKVSYQLSLNDNSYRRNHAYDALFKLGLPFRTLGLTGSISDDDVTKKAEAAISWDMDRDLSKKVAITASATGKDYTKADISLMLPAELQVDTKMVLNQGNTVFDGQTEFSYSRDTRKTLTLFSRVKNVPSSSYRSYFGGASDNFNYTFELGMRHPETKVDMTIDSHMGMSDEALTSSVELSYLTSRRQVKNLALWTEIDRIKKQINLVATGPKSNYAVTGMVVREEPLRVEVTASSNREKTFTSSLDVDHSLRVLQVDIGEPSNMLSFKAVYPNNSAFEADLYQQKSGIKQEEGIFSARLVNPRLLHCRLHWRPEMIQETEDWLLRQIREQSESAKKELRRVSAELEVEVSEKYRDITESVSADAQPILKFVEDEFAALGQELTKITRRIRKMVRRNEFYLGDLSENMNVAYSLQNSLVDGLRKLNEKYTKSYSSALQAVSNKLEEMRQYPVSKLVRQALADAIGDALRELDQMVIASIEYLRETDARLLNVNGKSAEAFKSVQDLYNHPNLEVLRKRIDNLRDIDYASYVGQMQDSVRDNLRYVGNMNLGQYSKAALRVLPKRVRNAVEKTGNEAYQEAKWAYAYWEVEENLQKNIHTLMKLLQEIIEDELKELVDSTYRNPITVFDPERGVLVLDLDLPISVDRIDQLPDLEPLMNDAREIVDTLSPHANRVSKYMNMLWDQNQTSSTNVSPAPVQRELNAYNPIKVEEKTRRYYRRRYSGLPSLGGNGW
ncbi:uncharacterized protein LOC101854594 [Aplysia californica]|uniref:Uncharacterized protein LOC101854594 n=1 Tax=Aplysia californica TaxID=6500 RepID=A0ABM1VY47_APLCA|nr:uncharacterized protein LOC101854594 [Aplysia californica]